MPRESTDAPAVSSWVFDDEDVKKLKNGDADSAAAVDTPMTDVPEVAAASNGHDGATAADGAATDAAVAASTGSQQKVGRFTVTVTDVQDGKAAPTQQQAAVAAADEPQAAAAAPVATAESSATHGRVLTQGRFEVSDLEDSQDNK